MTQDELNALKNTIYGPRKVTTDSGSVEERTVDEIKKGVALIEKQQALTTTDGSPKAQMARVGVYGRVNL